MSEVENDVYFRVDTVSALGFPRETHLPNSVRLKTDWLITGKDSADWHKAGMGGTWAQAGSYSRGGGQADEYFIFKRIGAE